MKDETFNRLIRVRYIIPLKIVLGAMIMVLGFTVLNSGEDLTQSYTLIAETITYSVLACIMYTLGDYLFYLGSRIYRRYVNKEDEKQ